MTRVMQDSEEKSPANGSRMVPVDKAFNDKRKKRGINAFSCPSSTQDSRQFDMGEKEEVVSTLREVLRITGIDSHQPPELAPTCPSFGTRFQWSKSFKLLKKISFKHLPSSSCFPNAMKSKSKSTGEYPVLCNSDKTGSFVNFSLSDLKNATNNFSNENLIGRGGQAVVYKGRLQDGQLIAVKRLVKGSEDERTSSFLSEVGIMAHVDHPNTAKLIGCGIEEEMHLVFQLSPLGNLGSLLHGSNKIKLDWSIRHKIIMGIANGLLYLHENCQRRIIHRDIKPDNILLAENFEPQICDFGLAKWLPEQCSSHYVSKFEGTFGYFAPEYLMHGIVNEKTDVYSFGILLLEIITGHQALDHMQQSIVLWAKPLFDANQIKDLIDPSLGDEYDREQVHRAVLTASLCVEQSPILRPSMSQVAILLRGDDAAHEIVEECPSPSLQRTCSEELQDIVR
ncbi:receptor-like cytosolic serine/threonine-protein kinase RBK2 [Abrus precatorius]|uniref:non-specific serine/threonine protein kinase n=1 Tax=Abrus precatorius TaxID=3816 RepID=A0A8B8L489_ABRPR|nr:receptor-like cytosolic serine/threonine-protein kinase RBK2 [Abrus precatorius]